MPPILSEDNILQIKMKFIIWIAGIIIAAISTLGTWQQIQISNLKADVKELEDKKVGEIETKIYIIKSEDIPQVSSAISVHESQLNTINTVLFGHPIKSGLLDTNIPKLPNRP